ncbi:MAG: thermonuclease family protein [Planctomycetota bacterium]
MKDLEGQGLFGVSLSSLVLTPAYLENYREIEHIFIYLLTSLAVYGILFRFWIFVSDKVDFPSKPKVWMAFVVLQDGTNVNAAMIASGMAWHYGEYSNSEELGRLEFEARQAQRGLWAGPDIVAPWEWRKTHKEKR